MARSAAMKYEVEKLDTNINFGLWQVRMQAVLTQAGLKKAIWGKENKPEKMTDEQWNEMDEQALSAIQLCLSNDALQETVGEKTAAGLWSRLEKLYMTKSLTNRLRLKQRLYGLHMEEGSSLQSHIAEFNSIINDLTKIDVKVDDEDKALLLLCSLPPSYKTFRDTMIYGRDSISLEDVKANLQNKSKIDGDTASSSINQGDRVLAHERRGRSTGKGFERSRSKSKASGKGIQCYHCKEFGHIKRNCPRRDKVDDGPNMAVAYDEQDGTDELITICEDKSTSSRVGEWVIDSGCSVHVCSRRDYFDTFKETKGGVVSLGDGSTCDVEGSGTVKIRMFDGVVRTLGGVAYVPKVRGNYVSVSQLDSKDYRTAFNGGVVKITRGCMVLAKGRKCGKLYRLDGSTVIQVPKISKVNRKPGTGSKILRKVSFAVGAETVANGFRNASEGDKRVPAAGRIRDPSSAFTM